MDFVSPEHLFEELPLTKEEAGILIMISRLLENKGRSGYFLSWVLFVRSWGERK